MQRVMTLMLALSSLALLGRGEARASQPLTATSPDGNLVITFELKAMPQPYLGGVRAYYRVSYKGQEVLRDSPLGLDFKGGKALDQDFELIASDRQSHDSTWENRFGAERQVRDHYNQLTVSLRESSPPNRLMTLEFRAYDEGVAFRYVLPKQDNLNEFVLSSEDTGFYFARDASAFTLPLTPHTAIYYENDYFRKNLDDIKHTSLIGLPLLVKFSDGPWMALLEADLTDYAGMALTGVAGVSNALTSRLAPLPEKTDEAVKASTPKSTPWRIIMINSRAGALIENNFIVLNLSAPCALADTSWITPGRAAWDWWSGSFARNVNFKPGMNTETMIHYVDFAARNKLEYMLIDAGWAPSAGDLDPKADLLHFKPEVNIPLIIDHAKQKGVKVLLWAHWRAFDERMDEVLATFKKWGAVGVKIDYLDRDDQEMVNFCERALRKAAEAHMVVDFHGTYKPTGLRRTYPNFLTQEGIMAAEFNKWSKRITPEHNITLAFTRFLAGPADYTPGGFRNATREQFKPVFVEPMTQGTRAHELAKYVVFESPLTMVSDYPEAYEGQPGFEFIKNVPTVWDKTKVLSGEPPQFITMARQKDNAWYVGAMTNWDPRDLEIPLSFLGSGEFDAQIFADGADADKVATSLSISTKRVKAGDKLNVHLAPGGGLAVILKPAK